MQICLSAQSSVHTATINTSRRPTLTSLHQHVATCRPAAPQPASPFSSPPREPSPSPSWPSSLVAGCTCAVSSAAGHLLTSVYECLERIRSYQAALLHLPPPSSSLLLWRLLPKLPSAWWPVERQDSKSRACLCLRRRGGRARDEERTACL